MSMKNTGIMLDIATCTSDISVILLYLKTMKYGCLFCTTQYSNIALGKDTGLYKKKILKGLNI